MGLSLSSMADLFSETFNESRVKVKINKRTLESFIYKYVNFGHLYLKFTNFRSKLYACCASFFFLLTHSPCGLFIAELCGPFSETLNELREKAKINKQTLESFIYKYVDFGLLYLKFTSLRSIPYVCAVDGINKI